MLRGKRDFKTGKFSLQFSLCGLGDKGQFAKILAASRELTIAKTGLAVLDEGDPTSSDVDRFSSHKV